MEGAKVYVHDAEGQWQKATIVAALGNGRYRVQLDVWENDSRATSTGQVVEVDASKMEGSSLPFQNSNMPETGFPNMTTLDHLHEAALLHNLRVRFGAEACPYTYTADIVIAVNPYRWFPCLYTEEKRKEYLVVDRVNTAPHVYTTSAAAYAGLREAKKDQSILVSGESGAGKTETVKILMGHLALIASSDDSSHIQRIVESNPLLESFGNAQTVRNDNSSRFGKFIELQLDSTFRLIGSRARTYLLEKSRVVGQDAGERNYHIFYQMLAADSATRKSYGLGRSSHTRTEIRYTRLGASTTDTIEGKNDAQCFDATRNALALVGVTGDVLQQMLRALAGVLLLGQLEFEGVGVDDESKLSKQSAEAAQDAAAALEVDQDALLHALTKRVVRTRNESFVKSLSGSAAVATRDALAKELYSRLFEWLVTRICSATASRNSSSKHFVGLLDIFGFESFVINRFEQLCINYANEKLQQKFTLDVFKAVQQEYSDEGIPWDRIEFKDNSPILALIESNLGLIALLNEECVRPKGSEEQLVSKATTLHKDEAAFLRPRVGAQRELQFGIRHYAGEVIYTTTGWLERNRDSISDDISSLLAGSANKLSASLFEVGDKGIVDGAPTRTKLGSDTVSTKFKTSLAQLMETIGMTSTQYVRCIKPNKKKCPFEMQNDMVVEQLRCAGVIEAIRISRAGFPARMPLTEFLGRFAPIVGVMAGKGFRSYAGGSSSLSVQQRGLAANATAALAAGAATKDPREACRILAYALSLGLSDRYVVGRTRVYFKSGVLESIEERRALVHQEAAACLTRHMRGYHARRWYRCLKRAVLLLQAASRMWGKRAFYICYRRMVINCQAIRRGQLGRRVFAQLRRVRAVIILQSFQRARAAMIVFKRARGAVVKVQAAARRNSCRKRYLADLAAHKEQAKLENQVKALQARLAAQEEAYRSAVALAEAANQAAKSAPSDRGAPAAIAPVEHSTEVLEMLNTLTVDNAKLRQENERQRNELERLRKENQQLRAGQSARGEIIDSIKRSNNKLKCSDASSDDGGQIFVGRSSSFRREGFGSGRSFSGAHGDNLGLPPTPSLGRARSWNTAQCSGSPRGPPSQQRKASKSNVAARCFPPLLPFWEDVPCPVLPLLKSGAEVHVKFGANILYVDGSTKNIAWKLWMTSTNSGYERSMAFFVERPPERPERSTSFRGHYPPVVTNDGSLGETIILRSALNGRYITVGGSLLDRSAVRASATKPDDATVFRMEPFSSDTGAISEHAIVLRGLKDGKVLRLRTDGIVAPSSSVDDRAAAALEFLLTRASYEIAIEGRQAGLVLSRDLPLRVQGFRPVPASVMNSEASSMSCEASCPGIAELSGRVHIGDVLTTVNGQDVVGVPAEIAIEMIACRRPVTLGFSVAPLGNIPRSPEPSTPSLDKGSEPSPSKPKKSRSLAKQITSFAKRTKAIDKVTVDLVGGHATIKEAEDVIEV